jgi:transketolase
MKPLLGGGRANLAEMTDIGLPVIYRTLKGWHYGVEGRASHGAGHKLCSPGFYQALAELTGAEVELPTCDPGDPRCAGLAGETVCEGCFWAALQIVRRRLEDDLPIARALGARLVAARERLKRRGRRPRPGASRDAAVYELTARAATAVPDELRLKPGTTTTLRDALGRSLQLLNTASSGALLTASADLLGSTSVSMIAADFAPGYSNSATNPEARLLSVGDICEDAVAGVLSGISSSGHAIGVGSSYGAFRAPLGHIAARLHAIGAQARLAVSGEPYGPMILICGHAGLKTGEDGPTHADPQALQLLQENFPRGTAVTLTPWEPQEIWPLLATALGQRPALVAPFVTRPSETVLDRGALGLVAPEEATTGVYCLRCPRATGDLTIVLQESAVTYAFVTEALPRLEKDGIDPRVYYVASAELFDSLPRERQRALFPEEHALAALGITGFTLPTLYRWVRSDARRPARPLPRQRPGRGGARRGRPRRREPVRRHQAVPRRHRALRLAGRRERLRPTRRRGLRERHD